VTLDEKIAHAHHGLAREQQILDEAREALAGERPITPVLDADEARALLARLVARCQSKIALRQIALWILSTTAPPSPEPPAA
jgi:hypothetical protein